MREKVVAVVLLLSLLTAVTVNTVYLTNKLDEICRSICDLDIKTEEKTQAEAIYEEYNQAKTIISLTVSHEDLTNIDDAFVQMISYISVGNVEEAEVTKSRLIASLQHLRRLSGFNIDSII